MQDFTAIEGDKDLSNKRSLTLENGNKIYFERKDPYGFWFVHYDKGQMPEKLRGAYTSYNKAKADVDSYLTTLKPEKKEKKKEKDAA